MSDSRVDKLSAYWLDQPIEAADHIRDFEAAGLVVIDPDDQSTRDALTAEIKATRRWFYIDAKDHAAAVLSFLAGRK